MRVNILIKTQYVKLSKYNILPRTFTSYFYERWRSIKFEKLKTLPGIKMPNTWIKLVMLYINR